MGWYTSAPGKYPTGGIPTPDRYPIGRHESDIQKAVVAKNAMDKFLYSIK